MPDTELSTGGASQGAWIRDAMERFERPLLRYAFRLSKNAETARDIVQDTFMRLCQAERDRVDDHLAEWLYTVCRNRALDVRRKDQRMRLASDQPASRLPGSDGKPIAIEPPNKDDAAPPSSERGDTMKTEQRSDLMRALDALPERQQEVIRLKFQGGLSYREIARVTDLSVSNVGFLIHTGIKAIRQTLKLSQAG